MAVLIPSPPTSPHISHVTGIPVCLSLPVGQYYSIQCLSNMSKKVISSRLISLCLVTKDCGVFSSKILCSVGWQPKAIAVACVVSVPLGLLTNNIEGDNYCSLNSSLVGQNL